MNNVLRSRPHRLTLSWIFLGHSGMITLVVFSAVYYLERTLFIDTAYQLFELMNLETLYVSVGRYSDYLVKAPALLAVKTGAGPGGVLLSFSVAIMLLYYLIFTLVNRLLGNPYAGLLIVLNLVLCMRHSFYHPMTETHQALVYSCLFWAWLYAGEQTLKSLHPAWKLSVGLLIIALAFFAHPVAPLLLGFVVFYFLYDRKRWKHWLPWAFMGSVVVIALLKMMFTEPGSYEGRFFSNLSNIGETMTGMFGSFFWDFFSRSFRDLYFFPTLLLVLTLFVLVLNREFFRAILVLLAAAGMFIILAASCPHDSYVMMEKSLLPWGFVITVCFVNEVLIRGASWSVYGGRRLFVGLILASSFIGISKAGTYFSNRLAYMNRIIDYANERGISKLLLPQEMVNRKYINVGWAYGFESLMYSTIQKKPPVTAYVADPDSAYQTNGRTFLAPEFSKIKFVDQFNPSLFTLDDQQGYTKLQEKIE